MSIPFKTSLVYFTVVGICSKYPFFVLPTNTKISGTIVKEFSQKCFYFVTVTLNPFLTFNSLADVADGYCCHKECE